MVYTLVPVSRRILKITIGPFWRFVVEFSSTRRLETIQARVRGECTLVTHGAKGLLEFLIARLVPLEIALASEDLQSKRRGENIPSLGYRG